MATIRFSGVPHSNHLKVPQPDHLVQPLLAGFTQRYILQVLLLVAMCFKYAEHLTGKSIFECVNNKNVFRQ